MFSIVIPAFRGRRFIGAALRSVRDQTCADWEIVLAEDGPGDGTAAVVWDFAATVGQPVSYVGLGVKAGTSAARNAALDRPRGDPIAFLDADDRWVPEKTAVQTAALAHDPGLAMVFGGARRFLDTGTGERVLDEMPAVSRCAGLFRRGPLLAAGPFGTGRQHEFMAWMLDRRRSRA